MADDFTSEAFAALREPFPPDQIGKIPKGGTQIDYVGHAAVTDRLLKVDPHWTWEPVAYAPDGGPLVRITGADAELWIRLTVAGVTRIGVGTAPAKSFELSKQLVSDAIRNAAMRFGVALALWGDVEAADAEANAQLAAEPTIPAKRADEITTALNKSDDPAANKQAWMTRFRVPPADLPLALLAEANDWIADLEAAT